MPKILNRGVQMRIGLLQCDHVADDLLKKHVDYQDMFTDLLLNQDESIEISVYDLTADQFPVDLMACDGYIITGSQFSAYDDIPWIKKAKTLITNLYQSKIPTIGICFGHQLIAEALGGKVKKAVDKGWGIGVQHWDIKNQKEWMDTDSPLNDFALLASHQDQVIETPEGSQLIASSDFCPIAGFELGSMLTFQGHPEFSSEYNYDLISKRVDRIGKEVVDAAKKTLSQKIDSNTVGSWMVEFIRRNKLA